MHNHSPQKLPAAPLFVWWIVWFAITAGLVLLRIFLGAHPRPDAGTLGFLPLLPLIVSVCIRFLLLPRMKTKAKALPVFIVGLATAEACGLLGLFLGGGNQNAFITISFGLLLAYIPFFARNYDRDGSISPFRSS